MIYGSDQIRGFNEWIKVNGWNDRGSSTIIIKINVTVNHTNGCLAFHVLTEPSQARTYEWHEPTIEHAIYQSTQKKLEAATLPVQVHRSPDCLVKSTLMSTSIYPIKIHISHQNLRASNTGGYWKQCHSKFGRSDPRYYKTTINYAHSTYGSKSLLKIIIIINIMRIKIKFEMQVWTLFWGIFKNIYIGKKTF